MTQRYDTTETIAIWSNPTGAFSNVGSLERPAMLRADIDGYAMCSRELSLGSTYKRLRGKATMSMTH